MATPDKLSDVHRYGRIEQAPAEDVARNDEWSEGRNFTFEIVGDYNDLFDKNLKPGDPVANISGWLSDDFSVPNNLYVRTVSLVRDDGGVGRMSVKAVMCKNDVRHPYNETWDVAMEEVQRKLIMHPIFHKNASDASVRNMIFNWENTDQIYRTKAKDNDFEFYYADGKYNPDGTPHVVKITNEKAIAYCKAINAGIETFNEYLPVITHVSYYLMLPGVTYDLETHQITGGQISEFSGDDLIGHFDEPDMTVSGYTSQSGSWFKSCDKFSSNTDGTWTRTEQWTFTRDKTHNWIYTGELENS